MSIKSEMEEEESDICDRFNNGEINQSQFNKEISDIRSEYRSMAEEACQSAYDDESRNW